MALALDSTAHPSGGGNLTAFNDGGGAAYSTIVTPGFSTGAGPILFVFVAILDSGTASNGPGTASNTSGLTWTRRATFFDANNEFGAVLFTAFSATGSLSSQTVTYTVANTINTQNGFVALQVISGVGATEAASIGTTGGFSDSIGVSSTVNVTIVPSASNSWLVGIFSQLSDFTVLTADANTTPFDATHAAGAFSGGGYMAFGRYKVSGTVALTTALSPVTFGSSTSDLFRAIAAIEVKVGATTAAFEDDNWTPPRPIADDLLVVVHA